MFGTFRTYTEYLDARIVALKQCAWPIPVEIRPEGGRLTTLEADRLRGYVAAEGYGEIGTVEGGWAAGLADVSAELPEAPAGCNCEGCAERLTVEQRLAREMLGNIARALAGGGERAVWKNCKHCKAWSRRAAEHVDGLCANCAGAK